MRAWPGRRISVVTADGRAKGIAMGPLEQLLREAIGRLASPDLSDAIIVGALGRAGRARVPTNPAEFGAFAGGALRLHVQEPLGTEAAEAVIVDLGPAFAVEPEAIPSSGVRRRQPHSLAPPSADAPVVLVASATPAEVDDLVPRLRDYVKVVAAYDVFALLSAAQRYLTS